MKPRKTMKISVIVCTYNRCRTLGTALESVALSVMPPWTEWEVLVVDNNSNDQTPQVVADMSRRHPGRFRYTFESHPGKSYALNSGIREARGEVLAFMDDDVIVEPTWLRNLTAPLRDGQWAGVGGRILPQWSCPPPSWVPTEDPHALALLAMFDLGVKAGPLLEPPFGTNMAFRKSAFAKYEGFRSDLGPQPGSEIRGEDTEFGRRVLEAGEHLWYEPSAIVHHPVPAHRLRRQYFLRWWFDKGRSDVREFGVPKDTKWFFAGIPLFMFRRLTAWTLRWMLAAQVSRRFSCKLKVWTMAGGIYEAYQRSSGAKAKVRGATVEF